MDHSQQPLDTVLSQLTEAWERGRALPPRPDPYHLPVGLHFDVPFDVYTRVPALNKSSFCRAKTSLAHFRYAAPPEDSPAFRMGSFVHAGKLEPTELPRRYVVVPDSLERLVQAERARDGQPAYEKPRATKRYRELVAEFLAQHPGKQEVSQDWFDNLAGMLRSLLDNPACVSLFAEGYPEVTAIWKLPDGELAKARLDWLTADAIVDLKTTDDIDRWLQPAAAPVEPADSIPGGPVYGGLDKYDYHVQAAYYLDGLRCAYRQSTPKRRASYPAFLADWSRRREPRGGFWFVVVEKKRPWSVLAAPTHASALDAGRAEYLHLTSLIQRAEECPDAPAIQWPGPASPAAWGLSRWYNPDYPSRRDGSQRRANPY